MGEAGGAQRITNNHKGEGEAAEGARRCVSMYVSRSNTLYVAFLGC